VRNKKRSVLQAPHPLEVTWTTQWNGRVFLFYGWFFKDDYW